MRRAISVAGIRPIRYYIVVRLENISYPYFLVLSLVLHLTVVPLLWRKPFAPAPVFDPISVSFLPEAKPVEAQKTQTAPPLAAQRRGELARAKQLKRPPAVEKKPVSPAPQSQSQSASMPVPPELPLRMEPTAQPVPVEPQLQTDQASATRGAALEEASIFRNDAAERPIAKGDLLPGRRDLIGNHRAIPLNTSDARYAPYTQMVKQWIEARWEYPDLAKHYGLQGRVVVEFTILQNGHIEFLSLVRSSGSKLLDEEAVRAIKAAVPFKPFPRSIQESSLRIIAGFIYSDQRLRVGDTQ
jgi:periplasmic protein TonB